MIDTIPWAARYLMALESNELHRDNYEYGLQLPSLWRVENTGEKDDSVVAGEREKPRSRT